ncbi:plasmid mobilization protein [Mesorhizobium sp. L-8-3]
MAELVATRVSGDERRLLTAAARSRGLSLSEFLRRSATEAARQVAA